MTQIAVLANEIHEQAVADFKVSERFAYSFIMKVKRIREERLYKELGFSSFDDYCDKAWNVVRRYMDQRIQIADAFGTDPDFENTYSQLGHSKSLLLARMEPEVRQQIESTIDVNETTVRQLSQLEQRLKEEQKLREQAEAKAAHNEKLFNSVKNQPPRVETRTVEVIPERLQKEIEQLRFDNTQLKHGYQDTKEKLQHYELRNTVEFDAEEAQKQREKLQHEADINALQICVHVKNFIEKAAITSFMEGALAAADPITKRRVMDSVDMIEKYARTIKLAVNSRILGGVINE